MSRNYSHIISKNLYFWGGISMRSSRVFLSYNHQDYHEASIIKMSLENVGLEVSTDSFESNNSFYREINHKVKTSDYFIILISHHTESSEWTKFEIEKIRHDFYYRDVVIIPVLISEVKKPNSLKNLKSFKLYEDFEKSLNELASYLKNIKYLDFDLIAGTDFENLITDLLIKLKFKIDDGKINQSDYGIDIVASSINRNQLVDNFTTNWLIQCKFYKNSRIDVSAIKQLTNQLVENFPNYNGIFITNSLITSTILETLDIMQRRNKVNIEVVDGRKLKQLLLKYPDLIEKFFYEKGGF